MYIELSRNTPLLVQLFFINDQDDKSDIDGAKGNETLLNWINEEIQSLKEEQFFIILLSAFLQYFRKTLFWKAEFLSEIPASSVTRQ